MRIPTFRLLLALAAIIVLLITRMAKGEAFPAAPQLGLQLSLTTSGVKFDVGNATPVTRSKAHPLAAAREAFSAAAILVNLSRSDTTLVYPSAEAAANRVAFQLTNPAGEVLWTSEAASASADASVEVAFPRRSAVRRIVQVPLKLNGAWLATGRYTLKADAGGASASVFFDVANTTGEIPDGTGIRGQLFQQGWVPAQTTLPAGVSVTVGHLSTPIPVAGTLYVERLSGSPQSFGRPISSTSVHTDPEGNFVFPTAPGRYQVRAESPAVNPYPTLMPVYMQVEVTAGKFTPLNFIIAGNLRENAGSGVRNIESATGKIVGGAQGTIEVTATTVVPTGGYTNPRLVQRASTTGALEFDFLIDPPAPDSTLTEALVTHTATASVPYAAYSYVRVYGAMGSQDVTLEGGGSF